MAQGFPGELRHIGCISMVKLPHFNPILFLVSRKFPSIGPFFAGDELAADTESPAEIKAYVEELQKLPASELQALVAAESAKITAEEFARAEAEEQAATPGGGSGGEAYVGLNPHARESVSPAEAYMSPLAAAPRKVPAAYRVAEVLPFRC